MTNLRLRPGDYAEAGNTKVAVVDSSSFWVTGYFEETKLAGIAPGMKARIRLMGFESPCPTWMTFISTRCPDTRAAALWTVSNNGGGAQLIFGSASETISNIFAEFVFFAEIPFYNPKSGILMKRSNMQKQQQQMDAHPSGEYTQHFLQTSGSSRIR